MGWVQDLREGQDLWDPNSATSLHGTRSVSLLSLSKAQFPHLESGLQSPAFRRLGKLEEALVSFAEVTLLTCVRAGLASGPQSRRGSRRKLGEGPPGQAAFRTRTPESAFCPHPV